MKLYVPSLVSCIPTIGLTIILLFAGMVPARAADLVPTNKEDDLSALLCDNASMLRISSSLLLESDVGHVKNKSSNPPGVAIAKVDLSQNSSGGSGSYQLEDRTFEQRLTEKTVTCLEKPETIDFGRFSLPVTPGFVPCRLDPLVDPARVALDYKEYTRVVLPYDAFYSEKEGVGFSVPKISKDAGVFVHPSNNGFGFAFSTSVPTLNIYKWIVK